MRGVRTVVLVVSLLTTVFAWNKTGAPVPTIPLTNAAREGTLMYMTGIGTGYYTPVSDEHVKKAVLQWLDLGGRQIDTAYMYGIQTGVGDAVRESGVPREEIFITSKVCGGSRFGYDEAHLQFKHTLQDLQTSYVDLLLIHWPGRIQSGDDDSDGADPCGSDPAACRREMWRALEEIYLSGQARAIGVSNFIVRHLEDIMQPDALVPSVNQIEFHPYWQEKEVREFHDQHKIVTNGYSPVGCPDMMASRWPYQLLEDPAVVDIAAARGVDPSEIVLRWEYQHNVVANPRTANLQHMRFNLGYFGDEFQLSAAEMGRIASIPRPHNPKVCPDPENIP